MQPGSSSPQDPFRLPSQTPRRPPTPAEVEAARQAELSGSRQPSGSRGLLVVGLIAVLCGILAGAAWAFRDELGLGDDSAALETSEEVAGEDTPPDDDGVVAGGDDEAPSEDPSAGSGDESAGEPPPFDPAMHSECPDDVVAEVCDAVIFVEAFRGRPFKEFPSVDFQPNDDFDAGLLAEFDTDTGDLEVAGEVFKSLGLIDPNADLVELFRRSLEAGVVGYYDPETGELVVRGTELDLYVQSVLVHELAHAFDDQWLDLDRPELDDAEDESDFGFTAVVEGNAVRVENAWREELSGDQQAELARLELGVLSADDIAILQAIPNVILQLQYSPYIDGPVLVEKIARDAGGGAEGEAAVDAAIVDPPIASEQVLDPGLFGGDYEVVEVPEPRADGQVIDEGVIGELLFGIWLGERIGDGWGGDRYVTWREGDRVCTAVNVAADTDEDLDEYFEGATVWQRSRPDDRSVTRVVDAATPYVALESCA